MTYLAALLAGLGGLLVEMVLVRRHGLLLGNTAAAAALVLSLFLLGLGVGGLLAGRLGGCRPGPRRLAAALYLGVGAAALALDAWLARLGAVDWPTGCALAALAPGALAVGMGAAFPLLFALQPAGPWRCGGLVAANLLGSVAAAWLGGNLWIPGLGLAWTLGLGALAYALAAAVLALPRHRRPPSPPAARRRLPWRAGAAPALASGALVLGLEVLLLRRLPFWLEGLQPTLSGVVAVCLLGLTAGAALGTPLLRALCRGRAVAVALALGAVGISAGLHEVWTPRLAAWPVESDAGLHLRILAASLAAAFPPCFALGAVVPLLLARLRHGATRSALAGRLFFWQGVGGLGGALLVGVALPALVPEAYFAAAPGVLVAAGLLPCWRRGGWPVRLALAYAVAGALGVSGSGSALAPRPPVEGSRVEMSSHHRSGAHRYLRHRSDSGVTASVVYDRRQHSMVLFTDGFRAAETGPGTAYMKALGHLPMLLRPELRRVAVVALGTGTTADAVAVWPGPEEIAVVEISPAVFSLVSYFSGDGPLAAGTRPPPFATDPRTRVHLTDGRRFLARRAAESLDLITLEPLLPYAPGTGPLYTAEFYALAARALQPDGVLVQWVPTHAMPVEFFDTLLATCARSFAHCSVWLVDQATLVVGSKRPHLPSVEVLQERFDGLPGAVRAALHETGLAGPADLQLALIGDDVLAVCGGAPDLRDERPALERVGYWSGEQRLWFFPENLERLAALAMAAPPGPLTDGELRDLRRRRLAGVRYAAAARLLPGNDAARRAVRALSGVRTEMPDSVLLHREETLALRTLLEREAFLRAGRGVASLARRHLRRDLRSAVLHACSALADARGGAPPAAERRVAVETALALDPLVFAGAPAFLRELAPLAAGAGPSVLADLQQLPGGAELVALATRPGAAGLAVQAVFPVRVARALLGELARAPLRPPEVEALRAALDPRSLELAAAAVVARGGRMADELYPLWRSDLPMPEAARSALGGDVAARVELARALREHRGGRARHALADLLVDPHLDVRTEASLTLFETWGDRVPYDPQWDESRRRTAAERLRSLHNPGS